MAILLNASNTLIIETPRTGTTWIRKVLESFNIDHAAAVPLAMPCCPRHSPRRCHEWDPSAVYVTVRRVVPWLESFWKLHHVMPDAMQERPDSYPVDSVFEHARLFPVLPDFGEWVDILRVDMVREYWLAMCEGAGGVLRAEHLEEDLSPLIDVSVETLRATPLQHVSRPVELQWPTVALVKFHELSEELHNHVLSLRHG